MCSVSMIADHYQDKWKEQEWWSTIFSVKEDDLAKVTRDEFEALRKEVQELKELLKKAKKYDEENNQPDCEQEEKVELIRKIAKAVGVDLSEVFP